jgi:hypothetical protein
MEEQKRHSGFETMRILSMVMIVLMHGIGHGGLGSAVPQGSAAFWIYWLLFILARVSTNCFVMLSGYYLSERKGPVHVGRLFRIGAQVWFYSMHFDWERGAFTIEGAAGQTDLIPEFRDYTVELCGVKEAVPKVYISGKKIKITYEYQWKKGCIRIHIPKVSVDEKVEIVFEQKLTLNDNHTLERVYDLLNQAQDSNLAKESAYRLLSSGKNLADILGELETTNLKKEIRLAVIEIMTADL